VRKRTVRLAQNSYKLQASEFALAWLTYRRAILWRTSAQELCLQRRQRLGETVL
jgi:hypothetical protein